MWYVKALVHGDGSYPVTLADGVDPGSTRTFFVAIACTSQARAWMREALTSDADPNGGPDRSSLPAGASVVSHGRTHHPMT